MLYLNAIKNGDMRENKISHMENFQIISMFTLRL